MTCCMRKRLLLTLKTGNGIFRHYLSMTKAPSTSLFQAPLRCWQMVDSVTNTLWCVCSPQMILYLAALLTGSKGTSRAKLFAVLRRSVCRDWFGRNLGVDELRGGLSVAIKHPICAPPR